MKLKFQKTREWVRENKIKSILILLALFVITLGVTLAYFFISESGGLKEITMGTIKIEYTDGETINSTNGLPLLETEVDEYASKTTFVVKNTGNLTAYAEIQLLINDLPAQLNSEDFRWTLYKESEPISTGSFKNAGSTLVLKKDEVINPSDTGINYAISIWIRENNGNQNDMLNKTLNAKINVKALDKKGVYAESGINPPELVDGLIPVTYDETNDVWIKANVSKEWYSYANQEWANAVTVTSTNRNKYEGAVPGTEISMDDINAMWVWIPRYKYKITSGLGSSSALTSPPQIEVEFETGLKTTGVSETTYRSGIATDGTNTNYYTHPAFRNGAKVYNTTPYDIGGFDKELTGIWVGKFETGTSNSTCNTSLSADNCKEVDPIIKPDVLSLRYQDVSTQFVTSLKFAGGTIDTTTGVVIFNGNNTYGLTSTTDTHMMKNTEWGAVAILSQSKYGKMSNVDYTGTNKEVYMNNSSLMYTGRSGGSPSPESSDYGSYSYNDKACSAATCTGSETINTGTGASTTGTVYGVYDMSGGSTEYVMGVWAKRSGNTTTINSGFNGLISTSGTEKTDGISFPTNKYYDNYTGTESSTSIKENAKLGDATWETMNWYSDNARFVVATRPWFMRGGTVGNATSGIFYSFSNWGMSGANLSFRTVLIP